MLTLVWKWAVLGLPLPLLFYRFLPPHEPQYSALRVPFYAQYKRFQTSQSIPIKYACVLMALAWCALVLAVARPQWKGEPIPQVVEGRDLMLAIDLSNSMQLRQRNMIVNGQPGDRLAMVKWIAGDFIDRRVGDRLGLIVFGSHAYLQTPLTLDRRTVKTQLQESVIGMAGDKTAIGDAIGLAVKRMQDRPDDDKVLILLTDGENTAGDFTPVRAAELARQINLKIYTIRINRGDSDEEVLEDVSRLTGGRFFQAHDTESLSKIYQYIDELEPIEKEIESIVPTKELYFWPGAFAFLLVIIALFMHSQPMMQSFSKIRD